MEQERVENQFFDKEKKDTGTGLFKPYKPMSLPTKVGLAVGSLFLFGAIVFFSSQREEASLWVMNAGSDGVHLEVAGEGTDLESGKLLDKVVAMEDGFELGAFRGAEAEDIQVELRKQSERVALVDLTADAAYIVVDISPIYSGGDAKKPFPITHVSKPAKVHYLPYPALKLVRPGRAIPEKDSWELKAAAAGKPTFDIYKVFRVDPARLGDEPGLLDALKSAIQSNKTVELETLRSPGPAHAP